MPTMHNAPQILIISERALELKQKLNLIGRQSNTLIALDGEQGLNRLSGQPVEALILHMHSDWQPDLELLRHIRTFFPYLPVVVLAEYSTLAGAEACAGLSTQGYLRLPVSAGELWRAIDNALFAYAPARRPSVQTFSNRNEVAQALSMIHARHHEGLGPEQVASEVGMSRNHLGRLFKAETGHTLSGYINKCRVSSAMRIINQHMDMGFSQVAGRAGFSSESYFSKVFKRLLGINPKMFRLSLKEKGMAASSWCEALIQELLDESRKKI